MTAPTLGRCVALDDDLQRCRTRASYVGVYHGDEGIYWRSGEGAVTTVRVALCVRHATAARILPSTATPTRRRP